MADNVENRASSTVVWVVAVGGLVALLAWFVGFPWRW